MHTIQRYVEPGISAQKRCRLGEKLRELRENADMTQKQLGQELGMSQLSVSAIETGRKFMSPQHIKKLAGLTGTDLRELSVLYLGYSNPALFEALFGEDEEVEEVAKIVAKRPFERKIGESTCFITS